MGLGIYGFIILKSNNEEIGPNNKGNGFVRYISGSIHHCIGAGALGILKIMIL